MSRLKPRPTKHELSTGMEDIAGAARNELFGFSRDADGCAEQRARCGVRMCHASRMRCAAQRAGNPFRPAALFKQRHGVRDSEDVRARTNQCQSIGAGIVAAAFRPPAFCGSAEGLADVHTQRFAFRAPEEDDESVKMSNTTRTRSSALCAAEDATNVVILRTAPSLHAGRRISPAFPNTNFYSIQISPFLSTPNFQLAENKALLFFYSIQMKSHQTLITNHYSPKHGDSKWPKN